MEIRNVARKLRKEGKAAFFVRIEYISRHFEDAFEEGSFEEFSAWAASGEEGWLLLDSVDEARLRDPKDFEYAIKNIGRRMALVLQQAHIVIAGRTTAWRAKTDLSLCKGELPYRPVEKIANEDASEGETQHIAIQTTDSSSNPNASFRIVALDDLHGDQIDTFLRGRGIQDPRAFSDAVDRKDAWLLTTRPQDLAELVEFWNDHQRIGSRIELMQSSIARRLEERNQDHSEARPIATEKLRHGARLIAAATTLCKHSAIRVPDGTNNSKGISVREILTDWDDIDCAALLSRPIFDEGIYGTVRFHHRSVREYLTAEWLSALIVNQGSRSRIENLFFRSQYGLEVLVPTMRPILPWLAILNEQILPRICSVAPEVIFEGGDPSRLPVETRTKILGQACEQLAQPANGRSLIDLAGIQRFANVDLTCEIKAMFAKYSENVEVSWFLLCMVWKGEIKGASEEVKHFALTSCHNHCRVMAFRGIAAVGTAADQLEVRLSLLSDNREINRELLAEVVRSLPRDREAVKWLIDALERTVAKEQFHVDGLLGDLSEFISKIPMEFLLDLVNGFHVLLGKPPFVERHECTISKRYSWVTQPAAISILRLIQGRDKYAFEPSVLSILRKLPTGEEFTEFEFREIKNELLKRIAEWPMLNYALFWYDVGETRCERGKTLGRLTEWWRVGIFGRFWNFGANSFDVICKDIAIRPMLDDRLVALNLAFTIYRENGRHPAWRERLKRMARGEPEINSTLKALLHPPKADLQKWRKQEASWKKMARKQAERNELNKRKWKEYLDANYELLRDPGKLGIFTNNQLYLHERMRQGKDHLDQWSGGDWKSLIPEFGEKIAHAFRDGAVGFWRNYRPKLHSEGALDNELPMCVIFGLTGLLIESTEVPEWPIGISKVDAEVATRYALHELNGFPKWLPTLYHAYPDVVIALVKTEIDNEILDENPNGMSNCVLYAASWNGKWMWDRLAPYVAERLERPLKNINKLNQLLTILQGSSLEDSIIITLASKIAITSNESTTAPIWFAMWVSVDPKNAIPVLEEKLIEIKESSDKAQFAMRFITALVGGHRETRCSRQSYRTVEHLKTLYLIIHGYVREKDDIDHSGKGAFSPGLRDDAQDARNALLSLICEVPGKEAFQALMEISHVHPTETARPWIALRAKERATLDADFAAWSPGQVRQFHEQLESTPANHRDLWYLAIERLLDLKYGLEGGDASIASILQPVDQETLIRNYIGGWCRERSNGRYIIPQEEELADAKRPDLRFHGVCFEGPVPVELKLADKWTGPDLFERLANQLCGDYLRDRRSSRGIYLLVYRGTKVRWHLPTGECISNFDTLIESLQKFWEFISPQFPSIEDIRVIGINLAKRGATAKAPSKKRNAKQCGQGVPQKATAMSPLRAPKAYTQG